MDNPFAQTNAVHLLKPLMDMAKKTNTQLICLSGLGGESIYNRFDNIYVLNLVAAGLRNSVQYVRTEPYQRNRGGDSDCVADTGGGADGDDVLERNVLSEKSWGRIKNKVRKGEKVYNRT